MNNGIDNDKFGIDVSKFDVPENTHALTCNAWDADRSATDTEIKQAKADCTAQTTGCAGECAVCWVEAIKLKKGKPNKDEYGMNVSAFEARHASKLQGEPLKMVHSKLGMIQEDHEIKLVQCPFETNIATEDVDLPLCPKADKCTLVGYMDLCTVPHVHDFESPGTHINIKPVTKSEGFSLEMALGRVERATKGVRHMKRDGLIIVAPKRSKFKSKRAAKTGEVNTITRAEAYSVYEFNTTPPAVPKTEEIMTRAERFEVADRRETKRIQFIQDCRDFKIQEMLATC